MVTHLMLGWDIWGEEVISLMWGRMESSCGLEGKGSS